MNKKPIVTGAGSGIGREKTTQRAAKDGKVLTVDMAAMVRMLTTLPMSIDLQKVVTEKCHGVFAGGAP